MLKVILRATMPQLAFNSASNGPPRLEYFYTESSNESNGEPDFGDGKVDHGEDGGLSFEFNNSLSISLTFQTN